MKETKILGLYIQYDNEKIIVKNGYKIKNKEKINFIIKKILNKPNSFLTKKTIEDFVLEWEIKNKIFSLKIKKPFNYNYVFKKENKKIDNIKLSFYKIFFLKENKKKIKKEKKIFEKEYRQKMFEYTQKIQENYDYYIINNLYLFPYINKNILNFLEQNLKEYIFQINKINSMSYSYLKPEENIFSNCYLQKKETKNNFLNSNNDKDKADILELIVNLLTLKESYKEIYENLNTKNFEKKMHCSKEEIVYLREILKHLKKKGELRNDGCKNGNSL